MWFTGGKKYPILDPPAIKRLTEELRLLNCDVSLRALFLRSTIVGADINYMKELQHASQAEIFIRSIDSLCSSIQELRVPVFAVIESPCMGAGMEVAASCDIRIAVDGPKTIFAMPETKIGIPSVVQASLIPGLIGWGRAREMLYFGDHITAGEALTNGFLNDLTTPDNLAEVLLKWERLVDGAQPEAVTAQKALMRVFPHCSLRFRSLSQFIRPGSKSAPAAMVLKPAYKSSDSRSQQISRTRE
jgi:enoyl-CoA hydratase/carnithine racemase